MRIAAVQLPVGFVPDTPAWDRLCRSLETEHVDLLVLNELPFGEWPATVNGYDPQVASALQHLYEGLLPRVADLPVGGTLLTRAAVGRKYLVNEAVIVTEAGISAVHRKHVFPQEAGFFEQSWFEAASPQYRLADFAGLRLGALICTELMFTELARNYGRAGAQAIIVPRASEGVESWLIAARMAALTSGCYVISSNRCGAAGNGPRFGGAGFIVAPGGEVLAVTNEETFLVSAEINLNLTQACQASYPCYIEPDFLRFPAGIGGNEPGRS